MVHLIIANWWEKRKRILTASLFRRTAKWWVYVGRWASSENKHVSMMFAHLINRQHVCLLSDVYWTQTWIDTVLAHLSLYTQKLGLNPETEIWCAEWSFLWVSDMMKSFFGDLFWPWNAWKIRKSWRKWGRFPAAQKLSGEEIGNESPTQDAYLGLDSFLWLKFWVVRIRLKKCMYILHTCILYMLFLLHGFGLSLRVLWQARVMSPSNGFYLRNPLAISGFSRVLNYADSPDIPALNDVISRRCYNATLEVDSNSWCYLFSNRRESPPRLQESKGDGEVPFF